MIKIPKWMFFKIVQAPMATTIALLQPMKYEANEIGCLEQDMKLLPEGCINWKRTIC